MAWAPGRRLAGLQISASLKLGPLQNNFSCQPGDPGREAQVFKRNPCLPLQCCRYWSSNGNSIPATTTLYINDSKLMALHGRRSYMINHDGWQEAHQYSLRNSTEGWVEHVVVQITYLVGYFPFFMISFDWHSRLMQWCQRGSAEWCKTIREYNYISGL